MKSFLRSHPLESLLIVAMAIGLVIRLFVAWLDVQTLVGKTVADDAFLYFTLARNLAAGKGATFDGIAQTNGFHPLYALLLVPIFKSSISNLDTSVHLALTMLSVLNVLTAFFIFQIVATLGSKKIGLIASILWLFNPYVVMLTMTGVEAGLYAFLISATAYCYIKIRLGNSFSPRFMIVLGLLTGLTFLSRTDAIFLFAAIFIDMSVKLWTQRKALRALLSPLVVFSLTALITVSPWLAWNVMTFGTLQQTSGEAIQTYTRGAFLQAHGSYLSVSLLLQIAANLYTVGNGLLEYLLTDKVITAFVVGLLGGLLLMLIVDKKVGLRNSRMRNLDFALLFGLLLIAAYSLWHWSFQAWYFMPLVLLALIYAAVATDSILRNTRLGRVNVPNAVLPVVIVIALGVFAVKAEYIWRTGFYGAQEAAYRTALFIHDNTPGTARIGAFDAGLYGYYSGRTVINLDGVMNKQAWDAMKDKTLLKYIEDQHINYIPLDSLGAGRYRVFLPDSQYDELLSMSTDLHTEARPAGVGSGDVVLHALR